MTNLAKVVNEDLETTNLWVATFKYSSTTNTNPSVTQSMVYPVYRLRSTDKAFVISDMGKPLEVGLISDAYKIIFKKYTVNQYLPLPSNLDQNFMWKLRDIMFQCKDLLGTVPNQILSDAVTVMNKGKFSLSISPDIDS